MRNSLESSVYSIKNSIQEESVKSKLSEEELKTLEQECESTLEWLEDKHSLEETEERLKLFQSTTTPLLTKIHSQGPPPGQPQASNDTNLKLKRSINEFFLYQLFFLYPNSIEN